jgi:Tol biopolymer transport system component
MAGYGRSRIDCFLFVIGVLAVGVSGCAGGPESGSETPSAAAEPEAQQAEHFAVVFASNSEDGGDLFTLDPESGERHRLTALGQSVGFPVWSPSKDRVAFTLETDEGADLMMLDVASGEVSQQMAGQGELADWGPRGERLLITQGTEGGGRGLVMVGVTSGERQWVDTGSEDDAYARWSRDGGAITYESARHGSPEIYLTDLETGESIRLTENDLLDEWPSLSHDGSRIAWASGTEEDKNLWVMNSDGSDKRQLSEGILFGDAFPEWSPDGARILMTAREGDQFVLKLVDVASGEMTDLGEGSAPSWR